VHEKPQATSLANRCEDELSDERQQRLLFPAARKKLGGELEAAGNLQMGQEVAVGGTEGGTSGGTEWGTQGGD
jgi:hypothetical protein